jgi:hypothetical protein
MSFKFRKELAEDWQRMCNKYKVRVAVSLVVFVSLNVLIPLHARCQTGRKKRCS